MCVILAGVSLPSSSPSSTLFAHVPNIQYRRLCFYARLSRREKWLAFPPLVGVSAAGYFKGMVIREFLSSVRFWSHTAGICLGVAYPGGRSDNCIKKQIFPSEHSGRPDQVFSLTHIPWVAKEYVKNSFSWRKIALNMSGWWRGYSTLCGVCYHACAICVCGFAAMWGAIWNVHV